MRLLAVLAAGGAFLAVLVPVASAQAIDFELTLAVGKDVKTLPIVRARQTRGEVWLDRRWLARHAGISVIRRDRGGPVVVRFRGACLVFSPQILCDEDREVRLDPVLRKFNARIRRERVTGQPVRYSASCPPLSPAWPDLGSSRPQRRIPFITFETLDGGTWSPSAVRGRKLVAIHWNAGQSLDDINAWRARVRGRRTDLVVVVSGIHDRTAIEPALVGEGPITVLLDPLALLRHHAKNPHATWIAWDEAGWLTESGRGSPLDDPRFLGAPLRFGGTYSRAATSEELHARAEKGDGDAAVILALRLVRSDKRDDARAVLAGIESNPLIERARAWSAPR